MLHQALTPEAAAKLPGWPEFVQSLKAAQGPLGPDPAALAGLTELGAEQGLFLAENAGALTWLAGFAPLAFDSEVFGLGMAKVEPLLHAPDASPAGLREEGALLLARLAAHGQEQGCAMLSARVASHDLTGARALEDAGFRLADVSVTWRLDLSRPPAPSQPGGGVEIAPWQGGWEEELARLAAESFCDRAAYADRFSLDPGLSHGCPELYRRWLANSLAGEQADRVFTAVDGSGPAGFITARLPTGQGQGAGTAGWIVLNAIRPDKRGKGLYNKLLEHALAWLANAGCGAALVKTKASQGAVIRGFSRLGARQVSAEITFHRWTGE